MINWRWKKSELSRNEPISLLFVKSRNYFNLWFGYESLGDNYFVATQVTSSTCRLWKRQLFKLYFYFFLIKLYFYLFLIKLYFFFFLIKFYFYLFLIKLYFYFFLIKFYFYFFLIIFSFVFNQIVLLFAFN